MGCCYSRNDDDSFGHEGSDENHVPRGGNKPFTKKGMTWTSESPVTIFNLKQQRDAFWDTAPSYEGRLEIWQALRCACESEDLVLSQAIIDSANVTIPTGNLADGCYDELGNKYVIPLYCIVEPTNLIDYNAEGSSEREDLDSKLLDEELTESEHIITIRLSSNAKDVRLNYNPKLDTIATLRAKLCTNQNLEIKKYHVRFFLLGRIFEDKTRLCDVSLENEQILQAFISEKF